MPDKKRSEYFVEREYIEAPHQINTLQDNSIELDKDKQLLIKQITKVHV